jgi:hypothetical protein
MLSRRVLLLGLTLAAPAAAQPEARTLYAAKAARRYPQPVRVGDLIGRDVLEPNERQKMLGRVAAVRRSGDGVDLVVRTGGVLGIGAHLVAVPIEAVALLGEYVVLMDIAPDELARLPEAPAQGPAVPPDDTIRVGLVRPFH